MFVFSLGYVLARNSELETLDGGLEKGTQSHGQMLKSFNCKSDE
jgi:hypothetical protein